MCYSVLTELSTVVEISNQVLLLLYYVPFIIIIIIILVLVTPFDNRYWVLIIDTHQVEFLQDLECVFELQNMFTKCLVVRGRRTINARRGQ